MKMDLGLGSDDHEGPSPMASQRHAEMVYLSPLKIFRY
jgi:hypothetical protein